MRNEVMRAYGTREKQGDQGRRPTLKWARAGKVRVGVLLWALGVPIPLVLLFFLLRGCT